MSGFSQSFSLGDDTLETLDHQAAKTPISSACSRRTTRSNLVQKKQHGSNEHQMEVIDESPTNSTRAGGGNETRQRSVRERLKTIGTQSRSRKGIRRNKSESILEAKDQPQRRQPLTKCRSESREQINLLENGCSELFRSDIRFDCVSGSGRDKEKEATQVNILKLLESDLSFDMPSVSQEQIKENRPPDAKISRTSDEFEHILANGSDFSMDLVPRSQSLLASTRCSNKLENLFEQSVFTLDEPMQPKQRAEATRHSLSQLISSEDLLEFSELHETLRVEDTGSDGEENPLPVENVTFTQIPVADAKTEQRQLEEFLTQEIERSKRTVFESLKNDNQVALSVTLNSSNIPKLNASQQTRVRSTSNESMTLCGSKNLRLVANWGLPDAIVKAYAKKGITELFQWQSDCLANAKVILECANLVYSAPTSGGKTIVSEFLAAKTVVERKRKAIVILPFVAVAREKMYYLQEIFSPAGIRVEGFFGGHKPPGGFDSVDVAVCTIEKANSIVNRLLEQQKLADIGLIVVDEVHLISDPSRGYILELLLTKVRFAGAKLAEQIQIVAMSATLPNMELLVEWLQAEQFRTDFRPIELKEMLKLGTCIYANQKKLIRQLDTEQFRETTKHDQDNIAQLCLETILEGCSVIVFCPSKDWCERLAKHLAEFIYTVRKSETELGQRLSAELDQQKLDEALSLLKNCPTGLDAVLGTTARFGCVYHHAGLTADERDIIESCFKNGMIRIIVATSTLSSGVNLPARRVIIRTPLFGGAPMNPLTYRQMIGRAGRKGRDILGESILMCDGQNVKAGWGLVKSELKPITSCLEGDGHSHLKRAILEIIASGVARTTVDLETFVNCTLYSCEKKCPFRFNLESLEDMTAVKRTSSGSKPTEESDKPNPIASCVRFLLDYEFIRLQRSEETDGTFLISTSLGNACLAASMPPLDGFLLFSELQKSRQCFVLETELHAIYLVTPYSVSYQWQNIDWMAYLDRMERLSGAEKRVAELVGVREAFLVKALRGNVATGDNQLLQIHKRFYTALALQELVNEKPLSAVAKDFVCTRGLLQSLQQVAATFAGIVTSFCTSLNWNLLAMIVEQFRERLYFGVQQDLLDLMRIPSLNGQRARLLFDGGITGLVELANADPLTVEKILYNCMSFQTEQKRADEDEFTARKRMNLRNLYVTGRAGLTIQEAAKLMVKEARTYIQLDMGVCNPDWNDSTEQVEEEKAAPVEVPESENLFSPERNDEKAELQMGEKLEPESEAKQPSVVSFEVSEADSNRDIECFHNSLIMNFSHILDYDKESVTPGGKYDRIQVVDICVSRPLFQRFCEVLQQSSSVSVSFAFCSFGRSKSVIGANLLINQQQSKSEQDEIANSYKYVFGDHLYLSGAALTFQESGDDEQNGAVYFLDFRKDDVIDCDTKQQLMRKLFHRENATVDMFDAKDQLKMVHRSGLLTLDEEILANMRDPKVASWLLQAEDKVIPLQAMVEHYCPEMSSLCQLAGRCPGSTAPGLNYMSTIDAKTRCTVESFLVSHMMQSQLQQFEPNMLGTFTGREMPIQVALVRMELVGFPADSHKLEHLIERLKQAKEQISVRVRKLNGGRKLDFGSTSEVAAVLKVPRDRNGRTRTTRQVLERIDSPLAALVIAYRKIESNLSRTIEPLLRAIGTDGKRICGNSFCFTSTGRITMHEPNLQNVVKDFKVEIDPGQVETFSCRGTFVCLDPSKVLLSADFRQLELCVLTHLSQDRKLLAVLSGGKDVFRGIAAKWYRIQDEQQVSDELRNATKAIVYGVIYGMGARAMSSELNVDEDTARTLMEQFHSTYPEIRRYTERVVQVTRERGYIETLTGRRRYLPAIHSTDAKKRSEAERQAVCTTIQGSAADILKNAVLRMMRNLRKYRTTLGLGQVELVLHMHDELIFEVPREQARKVAKILKSSMENCAKLSLPLRVKVKCGASWGELQELNV
ncbi:DNA polymerase theta [Toxorhynchites rutilus septentrionalis]|uniref:DNA polymerase theta n=1 Tax=Toxorhynchites rutilus septentrionalis TaxID=329112 RepID=UPI002478C68A|nr:DNA polymerase theta [Toxorhynchites rutilus septentrionalis]